MYCTTLSSTYSELLEQKSLSLSRRMLPFKKNTGTSAASVHHVISSPAAWCLHHLEHGQAQRIIFYLVGLGCSRVSKLILWYRAQKQSPTVASEKPRPVNRPVAACDESSCSGDLCGAGAGWSRRHTLMLSRLRYLFILKSGVPRIVSLFNLYNTK
jgi:hypothetical protein